jgi:hypothetical protein
MRAAVTIALLLLATSLGAQSPREQAKRRFDDLRALFAELDRSYPFFDVKGIRDAWRRTKRDLEKRVRRCRSDQDFVGLLFEAIRCLRDGHATIELKGVEPPSREPEFYPGVVFLPAQENQVVVIAAPPGMETVLPPGTVVTRIDGERARSYLDARGDAAWKEGGWFSSPQRARFFEYRLPLRGPRGTKHVIHYRDGSRERSRTLRCDQELEGWIHNYNLPESLTRSGRSVWHTSLASGVGYVYLRRMDSSVQQGLLAALKAHPETRGWIVDLRGNTGGGYDRALVDLVGDIPRPVAAIIDAGAISAAETFARDLVRHAEARLYGSRSAGSSSSKKTWALPSGLAEIRFSVRSRGGIDGPIEFHGIDPHVVVEADPDEIRAGGNSALMRAERDLLKARRR